MQSPASHSDSCFYVDAALLAGNRDVLAQDAEEASRASPATLVRVDTTIAVWASFGTACRRRRHQSSSSYRKHFGDSWTVTDALQAAAPG